MELRIPESVQDGHTARESHQNWILLLSNYIPKCVDFVLMIAGWLFYVQASCPNLDMNKGVDQKEKIHFGF